VDYNCYYFDLDFARDQAAFASVATPARHDQRTGTSQELRFANWQSYQPPTNPGISRELGS